ncbi:UDP-3-O-(3-hydroxymyristoyl) glucosamine N-acyltransferase [Smithella sp. SCADC]|jgi:UDP-3-O-[3-hydroxymyristoyl] glucosamine N-acyltransferase|nr:UDP-3-O-(3-hydroxymyristoyl) glucosamine N-acyltransferase [Smithella sp. SCADC]KFO68690.1 UDP-3-O-(3-hydroxymyristoyl) glucosamine N-acyltransferase [Smithella sp. SCADC]HAR50099.1 UDP-3-O-(3-hydroxymyristoyl)glucosamine N-acyltransferase [Smithella sp.]
MKMTLAEIAVFLGGTVVGADNTVIENIRSIEEANEGDITFIANKKYLKKLKLTKASAVLVPPQTAADGRNLIVVADPYVALGKLLTLFYPLEHGGNGVSPDAYIEEGAVVSPEAVVFPRVFIGKGATIGKGSVVYPGVFVGRNVSIGENSILYANVTVYHSCIIGNGVILHSGVVIGADGFGFASPGKSNIKIPQIGFVQIDDDVEIGANTTVDRATLGKTWIQRNVKIDNLVQIAHNVVIGENSVITAQVGISGSTKLGKSVMVGGQSGMVGHIDIGDNVMIAADSKIHKNIKAGEIVGGKPHMPYKEFLQVEACQAKLPEMRATIKDLVKKVDELLKK